MFQKLQQQQEQWLFHRWRQSPLLREEEEVQMKVRVQLKVQITRYKQLFASKS